MLHIFIISVHELNQTRLFSLHKCASFFIYINYLNFSQYQRYPSATNGKEKKSKGHVTVPEYQDDIHTYLTNLEMHWPIHVDFLKDQEIDSKARSAIVNALMDVHNKRNLHPETLHLAVNIIDRFLQVRRKTAVSLNMYNFYNKITLNY